MNKTRDALGPPAGRNDLEQRRASHTGQSASPTARTSLYQRTGGISPTRRTSSKRLSSRASDTPQHTHRPPVSRKISRNNSPQMNTDIAMLQFAAMNSRPQTPSRQDSKGVDAATSFVNPTSTILQDLIKEQRASRGSRKMMSDFPEEAMIDTPPTSHSQSHTQSHENSPSGKQRKVSRALSAGLKQPHEMGVRESQDYISTINKQNFDLKLELYHRAQHMTALEKKLERMHTLEEHLERMQDLEDELDELREVEENNQRLRDANEKLQSELDKRDMAINEAVELICQLEAKVDGLEAERGASPSFDARPASDNGTVLPSPELPEISTPKAQVVVDIPDRTSSRRGTSRRPRKAPSFLNEKNRSTAALRSLYLAEDNKSSRSFSASTMVTSADSAAEPESPRLSILSECSYFSPEDVQPGKKAIDQLDRLDRLDFTVSDQTALASSEIDHSENDMNDNQMDRINRWIQPHQESVVRHPVPQRRTRALSDVSRGTQVPSSGLDEPFHFKRHSRTFYLESPGQQHVAVFGGHLPPTPDTMRTSPAATGSGSNTSVTAGRTASVQTVPDTPLSMSMKSGRPRSVSAIAKRPSTATSCTAASVDTTMSVRGINEASGVFHTLNHFGRGSSKATWVLGPGSPSNPRLSCYGGDLLFNGEGVEDIVSRAEPRRVASFESDKSDMQSTILASSPPPLSRQDWLEAAKESELSEEKIDEPAIGSNVNTEERRRALVEPSGPSDDPSNVHEDVVTEEPQLRRNPPLRLRAWANDPQPVPEAQPRRRLSLRPRFLSRNHPQRQDQEQITDPIERNGVTTHVPPKSAALAVSKHRRTGSGPGQISQDTVRPGTSGTGRSTGNRPLPRSISELRPSSACRPVTSDCPEHKRKASFLAWLKGSHAKEADNNGNGAAAQSRSMTEKQKPSVEPEAMTHHGLGLSVNNTTVVTSKLGDDSDWRARRRSRRMA